MDQPVQAKPEQALWWDTLPGTITKVAAFLTATAGLVTALGHFSSVLPHSKEPTIAKTSLVGPWTAPDCVLLVTQDDGNVIKGSCSNNAVKHEWDGKYSPTRDGARPTVSLLVTRTNLSDGCVTRTQASLEIIDANTMNLLHDGWNGCNIRTGTVSIKLTRRPD